VPSVPVGGPPTTKPAKGAKPGPAAPQPSATPILTVIDQDLAQIQAINDYAPAQRQVAQAQQAATTAGAAMQSARRAIIDAEYVQAIEQGQLKGADAKLRGLAIAAYIGVGFAAPTAGPQGEGGQTLGTVSSPDGLTGLAAVDASEMIVLVARKARHNVAQSKQQVASAAKELKRARAAYALAQTRVSSAEAELLASQRTLQLVTAAATTPGAASGISLPTFAATASVALPAPTTTTRITAPTTTTLAATIPALTAPSGAIPSGPAPPSPNILGSAVLDGTDLAAWFASTGRKANTTVPMSELAQDYQAAGLATGVRFDLAFAQSIIETGFFSFPAYGQLTGKDNNFAGIGACDTCSHGWSFPSAADGVGAQLELLDAYASTQPVDTHLLGPGSVGVGGCCQTWMALAGKWASSTVYGISIMTVYNQMLSWYIPRQLAKMGLAKPTSPSSHGPSLAPLPGGAGPTAAANTNAPTTTTVPGGVSAAARPPRG
jgi:hypothetical protein